MTPAKRGHTLLEVLMTGAILGLFMTMVCHALVVAYRTHTVSLKKSSDFRQATVALDRLARELRAADKFYLPDPAAPPWSSSGFYDPLVGTNPPMVFRSYDKNGKRVLGYRWDAATHVMQRLLYDPGFDPANAATHTVLETKKVTYEVESFKIQRMDPAQTSGMPFLHVELKLTSVPDPIQMEVRVKSL